MFEGSNFKVEKKLQKIYLIGLIVFITDRKFPNKGTYLHMGSWEQSFPSPSLNNTPLSPSPHTFTPLKPLTFANG